VAFRRRDPVRVRVDAGVVDDGVDSTDGVDLLVSNPIMVMNSFSIGTHRAKFCRSAAA
jgi:hypothetical protein